MIARDSFLEVVHSERIARISSGNRRESLLNDKKWELNYLRDKCKESLLEEFYNSYMQRLRISYLALFIIMDMIKVVMIFFVMLTPMSNFDGNVLAEKFVFIIISVFVWVILAINFRAELVESYPWVMNATSCIAAILMAAMNTGLSVHHAVINSKLLIPAYSSYILLAVYLFLPLVNDFHAFMLGMAVTVLYLISFFLVAAQQLKYRAKTFGFDKFITQVIFLLCNNLVGIYFRLMKQINIRIAFLDRHNLIQENLLLRYATEEEQRLLLNIMPKHIVDKIENQVKSRFEHKIFKRRRPVREPPTGKIHWRHTRTEELFIEPHNNVTILYADVVNYTHLTTTLDAKTLVEILHDLFVKFDTASEEYNVLRIKFLGDCYYAVAGISAPNEFHAKCCVDLGLRMIKVIQDVRTDRNLDIDMRIGVHTGSIFSGVIGIYKLQYDVWSKDLDIANHLEQTGIPGRVHVSEKTLKHLKGEYNYEDGPAQANEDPLLNSLGIRTFLIESPALSSAGEEDDYVYNVKHKSQGPPPSKSFMHIKKYEFNQFQLKAEMEICRELEKMPLGILRLHRFNGLGEDGSLEKNFRSKISLLFLHYKDCSTEKQYLREYDAMLKYSVLIAFIIFCCIMAIQFINKIKLPDISDILYLVLMIVLMFITWFKKVWRLLFGETELSIPTNIFTLFLFNASKQIQSSLTARLVIYLLIVLSHSSSTFIQLLDCKDWSLYPNHNLMKQRSLDDIIQSRSCEMSFDTWSITKSLELTIFMMFLFSRIPCLIKVVLSVLIACAYSIIIFGRYYSVYKKSRTTDYGLGAEYSHILIIIITLMLFHIMDYQTEFISKVDFNLRLQLQKKQEDAEITNASITMLVHNILPSHVADIYITQKMTNELYYEEYDNVAVMFATIKKYDIDSIGLGVLNEIICHFDGVLKRFESEGVFKVEKIKLAGWTYMAACGLNLGHSQNINRLFDGRKRSDKASSLRASNDMAPSTSKEATKRSKKRFVYFSRQDYMVKVMAEFALELMKTMNALNLENLEWRDGYLDYGMLRIGISNGPTMAGVIGSSKPHYDIWGDCVNMASRMDSTGVPGSIQVTEETAEILRTFEIQCNFRGMTFVKGRGEMPTYFIGIDENFNFVPKRTSGF